MNLYIARDGKQYGPYSEEQMQAMLAAGQVSVQDMAWREGLASWVPLSQLLPGTVPPVAPAMPAPGQAPYASPSLYNPQQPYPTPQTVYQPGMSYGAQNMEYAGFLYRLGAYIIDSVILSIVSVPISILIAVGNATARNDPQAQLGGLVLYWVVVILLTWFYHAGMESSKSQATLGKMACGLIVTDMNGGRISFWRATGRFFGQILSGCFLGFGYLMMLWSPQKQCLHDQLAGTLVVRK